MIEHDSNPAADPGADHVSRRSFIEKMGIGTFVAAFLGKDALTDEHKQSMRVHDDVENERTTSEEGDKGTE